MDLVDEDGTFLNRANALSVTMAPWVVRNARTFHRFIPVSAHDGDTLWISTKGWQDWHMDDFSGVRPVTQ